MVYYLIAQYAWYGGRRLLVWTGYNFIWIITPSSVATVFGGIWDWIYPPKTDAELLLEELKKVNKNIIELRENGTLIIDKNDNKIKIIEHLETLKECSILDKELPVAEIIELPLFESIIKNPTEDEGSIILESGPVFL